MIILGEFGLASIALLGLWIYAIFDVIATPDGATRSLPKMMWLMVVIFLPDIGSIAWLLLGRPATKSFRLGTERPSETGGAHHRERINQELSRSEVLNERLAQWERENEERLAASKHAEHLDARESELTKRELEAKQRELADWEARLHAREQSLSGEPDKP